MCKYLSNHEGIKCKSEGEHQEEEEDDDADEGVHDLSEHHHIDPKMLKSVQKQRLEDTANS